MANIQLKDVKMLPTPLDLKNSAKRNFTEILEKLQTGSILRGVVIGNSPKGDSMIHTIYGRFFIPNNQNLVRGDKIAIQIATDMSQIQGNIVSVNNKMLKTSEFLHLDSVELSNDSAFRKSANATNITVLENIENRVPKKIKGKISYLNLSNIPKDSALYKELSKINFTKNLVDIVFQVKSSSDKFNLVNSAFNVMGEFGSYSQNKPQLIKTDFGIISTKDTGFPKGKKFNLEIISLNNKAINFDIAKTVSVFAFNLNKSWSNLKELKKTLGVSKNRIIRNLGESESIEHIKNFAKDYVGLKELLISNKDNFEDVQDWQTIFVPFFNGVGVEDVEVKISRLRNHHLRFILNVNLNNPGAIELEGLVKFQENSKIPVNFDVILRSKDKLAKNLQKRIVDIFCSSQRINGIEGKIKFEKLLDK